MNTKIKLNGRWCRLKTDYGSLRIRSFKRSAEDIKLYRIGERILSKLDRIDDSEDQAEFVSAEEFHHLTLLYETAGRVLLKSDIVRSVPLFYREGDDMMYITDHLGFSNDFELDQDSVLELVETNYVSGKRTIYENIYGVQAAESVTISKKGLKNKRYFIYDVSRIKAKEDFQKMHEKGKELDAILIGIFQDLIESIPSGKRIMVPLSGGHDSRIIVNYLYRLGFENVTCFSYGIPGNIQSEVSRKVAKALDYEWEFVEYTEKKWKSLHNSGEFDRFIEFACNGVSNPHLQDFLAVYELKQRNIAKGGDIFLPGHGLDLLCNTTDYRTIDRNILKASLKRHLWGKKNCENTDYTLYKRFQEIYDDAGVHDVAFMDYLDFHERQAKFSINSFRAYEFFGFEARAPYWDNKLINYWLNIRRELKYTRDPLIKMEDEILMHKALKKIPFATTRQVNAKKNAVSLRDFVPSIFQILLLRLTKRKQAQNEGLNLIFSHKAGSIKELISPLDKWPPRLLSVFKKDLNRYPYQISPTFLTRLYTVALLNKKLKP